MSFYIQHIYKPPNQNPGKYRYIRKYARYINEDCIPGKKKEKYEATIRGLTILKMFKKISAGNNSS